VLASLYILCPGVATLPYVFDMYPSLMTVPLVAWAFVSAVHSVGGKSGPLSSAITGVSLSLLWLAHPPIAPWTTMLTFITQTALLLWSDDRRRALRNIFANYVLFAVLSLWYFVSVFQLGIGGKTAGGSSPGRQIFHFLNPHYVDTVVSTLRSVIPDIFL